MRERPNAADLVAIARETLEEKILARLPPELRFDGLMIVNALANAERELAAGAGPLLAERARLAAHYGESAAPAEGETLEASLARLQRRLAADIRAGRLDGNDEIARSLLSSAVAAVAESNPKYLKGRDLG